MRKMRRKHDFLWAMVEAPSMRSFMVWCCNKMWVWEWRMVKWEIFMGQGEKLKGIWWRGSKKSEMKVKWAKNIKIVDMEIKYNFVD